MATGSTVIRRALSRIGVLAQGETPSTDEANDALLTLNDMLDAWNTQRLLTISIGRFVFTLTSGQVYTVGPAQQIDLLTPVRPPRIEKIGLLYLANPAQPLEIPLRSLTYEQWAAIPVKSITSTLPQSYYYDQAFPTGNLNLWPNPTIANQLAIYYWQQFAAFADLVTDYTFPPAYMRAIIYNLALELAPEFGAEVSPSIERFAALSLAEIKVLNAPFADVGCDPGVLSRGSRYDWRSDSVR